VFECLACNLLQIPPLKLCFEKLRFFLNVFSECRKCYFRDPYSWGTCPQILLANSGLRYSAHTFGDRILSWGEDRENGPFGSFAPPLKNPLKMHCKTVHDIYMYHVKVDLHVFTLYSLAAIILATLSYTCNASMFNSQPQFTIKTVKHKAFDNSCLVETLKIKSGNIADCLENCRCQSFQICDKTKCQLCSSHKKENSSLLHDKNRLHVCYV
jgi:hypothetical protein